MALTLAQIKLTPADLLDFTELLDEKMLKKKAADDKGLYSGALKDYPITCLFLRNFFKDQPDRGSYNDVLILFENGCSLKIFNANTNPQPLFRKGVATVQSPQVLLHTKGKHGITGLFPHMAWRQYSTVQVLRDPEIQGGQSIPDRDSLGQRFWIDIHKGGFTSNNSLGCFTIPPSQWDEFKDKTYTLTEKYKQTALLSFVYIIG